MLFITHLVLSLTAQSLQHDLVILIWGKSNMTEKYSRTYRVPVSGRWKAAIALTEKRRELRVVTCFEKSFML